MKKIELKTLVKKCVKEVLLEEGLLSEIIAEVAYGIAKAQSMILEQEGRATPAPRKQAENKGGNQTTVLAENRKKLLQTKERMLSAIGSESMKNIFEGTEPLPAQNTTDATSPLAGLDPGDAGVDISGFLGLTGNKWKQLK